MGQDAIYWNLVIVGEALNQANKIDPTRAQQFTNWRKVIAFRNQVIHGYDVRRHTITWNVLTTHLPVLIGELERALSKP
jgi:uncharacterized protein with HEPN domain